MPLIAPSILSADFANLEQEIHSIEENGGDWVHVDVMDGHFVPNITIGVPVVQSLRRVTQLPLDVHLMIQRPIRFAEEFIKAGADWLTLHIEADTQENTLRALERIRALGCHPAISLKPGTPADAAEPYLKLVDMILVMTVEPGFGGQRFMEDMMPKLKALRTRLDEVNPGCLLQVDGGIHTGTAVTCVENGANVLVTGNAFFRAPDKASFVKVLKQKR